jgi:hypothetical protein
MAFGRSWVTSFSAATRHLIGLRSDSGDDKTSGLVLPVDEI